MELKNFIDDCNKQLQCKYCGEGIRGSFSYYGGGISSKDALKRHEEDCDKNPNSKKGKLKLAIVTCQKIAEMYQCLNCKHFQNKCDGTQKTR